MYKNSQNIKLCSNAAMKVSKQKHIYKRNFDFSKLNSNTVIIL